MIVKLWGVDRRYIHFYYNSESSSKSFLTICLKCCLCLSFFMKLTHIQLFIKKVYMKLESNVIVYKQTSCSFFLMFSVFRFSNSKIINK